METSVSRLRGIPGKFLHMVALDLSNSTYTVALLQIESVSVCCRYVTLAVLRVSCLTFVSCILYTFIRIKQSKKEKKTLHTLAYIISKRLEH